MARFFRILGMIISAGTGGMLILLGIIRLLSAIELGALAGMAWGVLWIVAGMILLPPISSLLRRRILSLRPAAVTPLVSLALFVAGIGFGAMLAPRNPGEAASEGPAEASDPSSRRTQSSIDDSGQSAGDDPRLTARRLIDEGTPESTTEAMVLMDREFGQRRINSDPALRALYAEASEAADRSMAADRARAYVEQVDRSWLPSVQQLSDNSPTEPEEIWRTVQAFEEAARQIEEGAEFEGHNGAADARRRLRDALVARQRALFPILRAAYGSILDRLMWERDVDVIVQGSGNRAIRFVAAIYAANRNIASSQRAARPNLVKLRFARAQYEWYQGSDSTYYTLETPRDDEVGYWRAGAFVAVE